MQHRGLFGRRGWQKGNPTASLTYAPGGASVMLFKDPRASLFRHLNYLFLVEHYHSSSLGLLMGA